MMYGGKLIHESKEEEASVQVVEDHESRHVHMGTPSRQSSMLLSDPYFLVQKYMRVMMLALIFNPEPKKVLILGAGAGCMAKYLWKHFPFCHITAVDGSKEIIDIGHQYFHLPKEDPRIDVVTSDAFLVMDRFSDCTFDLILVDLFVGDAMPEQMGNLHFFGSCYRVLKEGGVLSWNTLKYTPKELMLASVKSLCTFFFRNLLILPVQEDIPDRFDGGNNIFIVFKPPVPDLTVEELKKRVGALQETTHDDLADLFTELNEFQGYGSLFQQ